MKLTTIPTIVMGSVFLLIPMRGKCECPAPSSSISPEVTSKVSYEQKTGLYRYSYTIRNDSKAALAIDEFGLLISEKPGNVQAPDGWDGEFMSDTPSRVSWDSQMRVDAKGDPLHPYDVQPGKTLSGFAITSKQPPGIVKVFIDGRMASIPTSIPSGKVDEPVPNCPGINFEGEPVDAMVNALVQGPSDPNVISVRIRLRSVDNNKPYPIFSPTNASGKIAVLVLSSKTFDASSIEPSSLQFGPAKATPVSFKLVQGKHELREAEKEEWENFPFQTEMGKNHDSNNVNKRRDLLVVFDVKSIGVRCMLDHALFLTGKTKDGKSIVGAKNIRLKDCKQVTKNK